MDSHGEEKHLAMKEKEERRVASRNRAEAFVACRPFTCGDADHTADGVVRNFSEGGSYIESSRDFKLGTLFFVATGSGNRRKTGRRERPDHENNIT